MIKLTPAKCPSCGANIEVDRNLDKTTCQYCRTTIMIEEAVEKYKIEISGRVEVDGIATVNASLIRANQLMQDKEYDKANTLFKQVLSTDPTNAEAWWGRYLCEEFFASYYNYQDNLGNSSPEIKAKIKKENLELYAYKAIEYAKEDHKQSYKDAIKADEEYIEKVRNGLFNHKSFMSNVKDKIISKLRPKE